MIANVNDALPEPLPAATYEVLFREYWPTFETAIALQQDGDPIPTQRSSEDLLEEILLRLRGLERAQYSAFTFDGFHPLREDPLKREVMALLTKLNVAYSLDEARVLGGNIELEIKALTGSVLPPIALSEIQALAQEDSAHVSSMADETGLKAIKITIFDQ